MGKITLKNMQIYLCPCMSFGPTCCLPTVHESPGKFTEKPRQGQHEILGNLQGLVVILHTECRQISPCSSGNLCEADQ